MSGISNRLYVTALEDGTTLHANLASDKAVTQAWTGMASTPDWTDTDKQPTIYLTLMSGNSVVLPESGYKWLYNGEEIDFTDPDCKFEQTTYPLPYGKHTYDMPAIKIVDNLAVSDNVDIDTITFSGSWGAGGASISFACQIQVRLSRTNGSGYVSVINFANGISDITSKGQTISMEGVVYDGKSGSRLPSYKTRWSLNDGTPTAWSSNSTYQVTEAQVVDHSTIRCDFQDADGNYLTSAYAGIDDMQDPEYMYIQYNGNNGNAASLRSGETASFQIWVGTRDDATPIGGTTNPSYSVIKIKLIDGEGIPIGGKDDTSDPKRSGSLATSIPACEGGDSGDGWRNLSGTMVGGKATFTPNYTTVSQTGKKNLTGIVLAEIPVSNP